MEFNDIFWWAVYWLVPTPFAIWWGYTFKKSYKDLTKIRIIGFVLAMFVPLFNWAFIGLIIATLIQKLKK